MILAFAKKTFPTMEFDFDKCEIIQPKRRGKEEDDDEEKFNQLEKMKSQILEFVCLWCYCCCCCCCCCGCCYGCICCKWCDWKIYLNGFRYFCYIYRDEIRLLLLILFVILFLFKIFEWLRILLNI